MELEDIYKNKRNGLLTNNFLLKSLMIQCQTKTKFLLHLIDSNFGIDFQLRAINLHVLQMDHAVAVMVAQILHKLNNQ